jgi:hypothetical protein
MDKIFIPKKIKVGFDEREDTYTKKLAYIIYFDEKGKLRKETSWENWRDKNIPPVEYDNVPTSGFVLNKKVGDYVSDWNHRHAYVRIYDPRDFEFEITIENLLFILENTSAIKGKGLEGEFVYGWEGKDLILIPTSSPDYQKLTEYNTLIHQRNYVKSKNLVIGGTYKTKSDEEWIYMGRFDLYKSDYRWNEIVSDDYVRNLFNNSYYRRYNRETRYTEKGTYRYENNKYYMEQNFWDNKGKHYFFARKDKRWNDEEYLALLTIKSLGEKFIATVSSECVENYAELFDILESKDEYSPYDKTKDEYKEYTLDEFKKNSEIINDRYYYSSSFNILIKKDNKYVEQNIHYRKNTNGQIYYYIEKEHFYYDKNYEEIIGTFEDVFNKYHPIYKNKYLANGKFYRREY